MTDIVNFHMEDGTIIKVDFCSLKSVLAVPKHRWAEIDQLLDYARKNLHKKMHATKHVFEPHRILKDRNGEIITPGAKLDVQRVGAFPVYEYKGELLFAPYGKLEPVKDYFRKDLTLIEE